MYSFTGTPRDALHSITQRCTGGQDIAAEFLFNEKGGWRLKNSDSRKSISLKDIFNGKLFSWDGRFMELINGFGELVMLSVAFLICCIPVVTIGPAMTSLYYAVIKSVRRYQKTQLKCVEHTSFNPRTHVGCDFLNRIKVRSSRVSIHAPT